ncbi:MAG: glycosyltransferase [Myxococcota bacterium]
MRLLLVGAFPYPHNQGSQVYFQEQAIALRDAGAQVELLTYATQAGAAISEPTDPSTRALQDFKVHRSPRWTAPRSVRSGPSWAKPFADLGLGQTLRQTLASRIDDAAVDAAHDAPNDAKATVRYDAVLAHNAEAAVIALTALRKPRPPILYCVHTLMGHELSTYLKTPLLRPLPPTQPTGKRPFSTRVIDRSGRVIDRWIARRVDGWIALTQSSARVMQQSAKGPGALIPPPIPDPETSLKSRDVEEVCARYGLDPGRFFVYSGNLDPYQELDILAAVGQAATEPTAALPPGATSAKKPPVLVLASHDPAAADWAAARPGIQACIVDSSEEMQTLLRAARASLVLRKAVGGFPIKLANSLAVGTPAIAFHGREWGLLDGENSLLCDPENAVRSIANAIANLDQDSELALRLSRGARQLYLDQHLPASAARETLALIERTQRFRGEVEGLPGV